MNCTPGDVYTAAECLYKEARGEGQQGMICVMSVIMNRMKYRGQTATQVVMDPFQFTSMSVKSDPQYGKAVPPQDPLWHKAQSIAYGMLHGNAGYSDPTMGADMYYAESLGLTPPAVPHGWGNAESYKFLCKIGRHFFFRELH